MEEMQRFCWLGNNFILALIFSLTLDILIHFDQYNWRIIQRDFFKYEKNGKVERIVDKDYSIGSLELYKLLAIGSWASHFTHWGPTFLII